MIHPTIFLPSLQHVLQKIIIKISVQLKGPYKLLKTQLNCSRNIAPSNLKEINILPRRFFCETDTQQRSERCMYLGYYHQFFGKQGTKLTKQKFFLLLRAALIKGQLCINSIFKVFSNSILYVYYKNMIFSLENILCKLEQGLRNKVEL